MSLFRASIVCLFTLFPWHAFALEAGAFWRTFRTQNALFSQDIVASALDTRGERLLILSEPPPHIRDTLKDVLSRTFQNAYLSHQLFRHRIGFDGWVKDVVVRLHYPAEERYRFDRDIAALHVELFGTDYKASYRILEPKAWSEKLSIKRKLAPPNLEVSAASLNEWLFNKPQRFLDRTADAISPARTGTESRTLSELFSTGLSGVFHQDSGGLIVIMLDRSIRLNDQKPRLRQFFLDADAIIGAIEPTTAPANRLLAIIGRSRTVSTDQMPPLRVETAFTIAATGDTDLAQSYERTLPLAGQTTDEVLRKFLDRTDMSRQPAQPISHKTADWAPILLSRDITHTEFGNLLNVTDQILKGWSNTNTIVYGNFPYPGPVGGPPHVRRLLPPDVQTLTYNWNTAGLGSWVRYKDFEVFALSNTGALPVSYLVDDPSFAANESNEAAFVRAEDTFGRFFADYRDPNLNRVVQYTALHLIFRRFPVKAEREDPLVPLAEYRSRWQGMTSNVASVIGQLSSQTAPSSAELTATINARQCDSMRSLAGTAIPEWEVKKASLLNAAKRYSASADLQALASAMIDPRRPLEQERAFDARASSLDSMVTKFNDDLNSCRRQTIRSDVCAGLPLRRQQIEREEAAINALESKLRTLRTDATSLRLAVELFGNCNQAWRSVVDAQKSSDIGFQKTPTIVVSSNPLGYGGHNLDGRSLQIIEEKTVGVGQFQYDAKQSVLKLNPADMTNAQSAARSAERLRNSYEEGSPAQKLRAERRIQEALLQQNTVKPLQTALALDSRSPGRPFGAFEGESRHVVGWQRVELNADQLNVLMSHANDNGAQVVLQKGPETWRIFNAGGKPPYMIETATPGGLQRAIETVVDAAGQNLSGSGRSVVVISDGTVSAGDLAALRLNASTRQSALRSEPGIGGGQPPIPPGGRPAPAAPGSEPPKRSFNFGKSARDMVEVWARNQKAAQEVLIRTDANWVKASLQVAEARSPGGTGSIVARLEIPLADKTSLKMRIEALFKRQVSNDDKMKLSMALTTSLERTDLSPSVRDRIVAIRNSFQNSDADLRFYLETTSADFLVVELRTDIEHERRERTN